MEKEPKKSEEMRRAEEMMRRVDNPLELLGYKVETSFNKEASEMKKLLVEEYKKQGRKFIPELKAWREKHPKATFEDAIRSLYNDLEEEKA